MIQYNLHAQYIYIYICFQLYIYTYFVLSFSFTFKILYWEYFIPLNIKAGTDICLLYYNTYSTTQTGTFQILQQKWRKTAFSPSMKSQEMTDPLRRTALLPPALRLPSLPLRKSCTQPAAVVRLSSVRQTPLGKKRGQKENALFFETSLGRWCFLLIVLDTIEAPSAGSGFLSCHDEPHHIVRAFCHRLLASQHLSLNFHPLILVFNITQELIFPTVTPLFPSSISLNSSF